MIKKFHEKLQEITESVNLMGKLVQEAVKGAVISLTEDNAEIAQKVIDGDDRIDDLEMKIEQDCLFIHAKYQPFARDLRLINSMNIIAISLERIGDLAVNLAKITRKLEKHKAMFMTPEILDLIKEMAKLAKTVLSSALKAFKNHDVKLAAKLDEIDMEVDEIQRVIFKKLFASAVGNDEINKEEFVLYLSSISLATRYLERIGDQSVNIGKRILLSLTGDYKVLNDDINEG
jgi:phosphate transport system protein